MTTLTTFWPTADRRPMPRLSAVLALTAGAAAAVVLPDSRPGLGLAATGVVMAAGAVPAARGRIAAHELVFGSLAVALLLVVVLRDDPWLVALSLLASAGTASYALAPGRGALATVLGAMSLPLAGLRGLPWVRRGLSTHLSPGARSWLPAVRTVLVTLLLVLVFGALFASADAVFARLVPDVRLGDLPLRAFVLVSVGWAALTLAFLASAPPRWDDVAPGAAARPVRTAEWVMPIAALDLVFATFLTVQATVLFGGRHHLVTTAGLTYAQYARAGFGQLVAVTLLTVTVVAAVSRWAPTQTPQQRLLLRLLLGALGTMALLVVASALYRLGLYEQAYGFTRLRLFMNAVELWLGALVVLVVVAALRPGARWLPRTVVATGVLTLLALVAVDPDRFVAEHNLRRYADTGRLDVLYLQSLSADAAPAVTGLPEPLRSCVLRELAPGPSGSRLDAFAGWNLGRHRARSIRLEPGSACVPPGV